MVGTPLAELASYFAWEAGEIAGAGLTWNRTLCPVNDGASPITVLWDDSTRTADLSADFSTLTVRVTDMLGNVSTQSSSGVALSATPVYVEPIEEMHPSLSIRLADADIILSWPGDASGWRLQTTTNLVPGENGWWEIPPPYPTNGFRQFSLTETMSNDAKYYRLHKP